MDETKRTPNPRLQPWRQGGFTLIEITFAILILAGGLTVLLGLQSASIRVAVRDHDLQTAMLLTRRLLADFEADQVPLEIQDKHTNLLDLFQTYGHPDADTDKSDTMLQGAEQMDAHLKVEYWGLKDINPEAMKRISIEVSWGPSAIDTLSVVHFVPNDADVNRDDSDEEEDG